MQNFKALKIGLVSVFLVVSLSGCGGGSKNSIDPITTGNSAPEIKSIKSDFVFMSDFLNSLKEAGVDCAAYTKATEPSILAKEEGKCTYNGSEINTVLFSDAKTAVTVLEITKAFGGFWIASNNWAIELDNEAVAREVQAKLGIPVQ